MRLVRPGVLARTRRGRKPGVIVADFGKIDHAMVRDDGTGKDGWRNTLPGCSILDA
jgi:hypothetical protein